MRAETTVAHWVCLRVDWMVENSDDHLADSRGVSKVGKWDVRSVAS